MISPLKLPAAMATACGLALATALGGLRAPGPVPWPGGDVPYEFDAALTEAQKAVYLDGLREFELAANLHFVPRTAQPQWLLFKYVENGPNLVSPGTPLVVEIGRLTRHQICHETGHAIGLEHEHQRPDRDTYITVQYANVAPANHPAFNILPDAVPFGAYDFESVMHYGRDVFSLNPGQDTITTRPGYEKYQRRLSNAALSPTDRALLASMYGPPLVPLSPVVTTTADGGHGSLRAAIYYAQDHPGAPVTFNIPTSDPGHAAGAFTIQPTGSLPPLATDGLLIDATTQPGYAGKPVVFLNGSQLPQDGALPGLLFYQKNCTVKGLGVQHFPWSGMVMQYPDATGNRIVACSMGVDATGSLPAPNGFQGVMIADGAHGNFIGGSGPGERNIISGSNQYGVWISGDTTTANTVLGNLIGTDATGSSPLPNQVGGVVLIDGAHHNIIGGDTVASRNIISGNQDAGVWITGSGVDSNSIRGNYIGTNAAGNAAIPNTGVGIGIHIINGASDNLVSGNVLSGNASEGLRIAGMGTTGNMVYGNMAGTSPSGDAAIPNGFAGVSVLFGAAGNHIGGTAAGQGNVLSGNVTVGLSIGSVGTEGNSAICNLIGTNAAGTTALPNGFAGVYLTGGAVGNFLGDGPGTGNLVSGNAVVGVLVSDAGTNGNHIRNNRIGPDAYGANSFSSQFEGIRLDHGCQSTVIGGTSAGYSNIISGNNGVGIIAYNANPVADGPTEGHAIRRNSIFANGWKGIALNDGANRFQAAPVLSSAVLATGTTVSGSLESTPETAFTIEFFASPDGRILAGETVVTTDATGVAVIHAALSAAVPAGREIIATATSQGTGDTSEFSQHVIVISTDGDNDGLPNAYEDITPGLSSLNPGDAELDNDGDGFTNLQEFSASTNPNDSSSRFGATGVSATGTFQVSFTSAAGRFYRIERSDTLAGTWRTVALHVPGTGDPVQIALPVSPSVPQSFYRVVAGE